MLGKLCIAAALAFLLSALAHGAEPGANLSVQVVPPGSVPTEAANAGFATLAQSWDFSQPLYASQTNWYDCNGALPSVLFHQGNPGVALNNPCNVFQFNDDGTPVMDFQYLTSYEGHGFSRGGHRKS
jgi:hypothetical protein